MKDHSENCSSDDRILCPICCNHIKLNTNDLKISNGFEIITKNLVITEFSKLYCKQCQLYFTFILCVYCNRKIFMKTYPKDVPYNGLNGYNIKCPYQTCCKIFYFSKCPKCEVVQKQRRFIIEGNIITCLNDKCKFNYFQVNCPIKYCNDIMSFEKPKFFTNFPIGIMLLHKNEIMFQKINCYYCCRPIVFLSKKDQKNKYCEGQKVECPYLDCQKVFNRLVCPKCSKEIYINDGWYEMGSKIKCHGCNSYFGKILCPSCGKMNTCENNFFKLGHMKCGFRNCLKENNMVNCLYCRKLNIFDMNTQISGQVIKCGYCKNTFNEIFCPFCKKTNPFPLGDFAFGKIYKCQYYTCMKKFQFLICPKCHIHSFITDKQEGKTLRCEECQTLFMNWGCPFCKANILDENTTLKFGEKVKCPSKNCNKTYSFLRCWKCQRLIFSKENEILCGKAVKCPYQDCKAFILITYCPKCQIKITFAGKKSNLNEGENVFCENCQQNFIFQRNNSLYEGNLKILEQIEGKTIDFGKGEVDDNYLAIQDLFFGNTNTKNWPLQFISEQSEKNSSKKGLNLNNSILRECIICHNNYKESVFVPCGHRCVCYNCALIVFSVYKKCPKCNKEATCFIKKVYE